MFLVRNELFAGWGLESPLVLGRGSLAGEGEVGLSDFSVGMFSVFDGCRDDGVGEVGVDLDVEVLGVPFEDGDGLVVGGRGYGPRVGRG